MEIIKAPNEVLRAQTKPVKKITPGYLKTVKEMITLTKTFKDPEGVGLASTQVGRSERFFVAKSEKSFYSAFNPQIISLGKRTKVYLEGCLSIPDYYGEVRRNLLVRVSYQNEAGKAVLKTLKGIDAWIFQHETDHLNGILFPDRVLQQKGKFYKCVGKDETGTDIFEEVVL
ncbi:peptide deformylase [Candidatus Daviesbacteria bacterium RIFCSPLOWO2_01_FULL_37_10]|nr:MAG: peptide deformylase [Candidatus Daviesbacteria bacterium GWA1_38_6]OGE45262.1 MAG: peptide deformylase [Candidatus Daviesbacteria bacterium RIFCSPLOWO2_01_FULL_37_10]